MAATHSTWQHRISLDNDCLCMNKTSKVFPRRRENALDISYDVTNSFFNIGVVHESHDYCNELSHLRSTLTIKLMTDRVSTKDDAPDDTFCLYSAEPQVTPQ